MTLQEIADYAMDYLDKHNTPGEYLIYDNCVTVLGDKSSFTHLRLPISRLEINSMLKRYILNT